MLIVLREKTLQDINMAPKELKTERDCSHRQLFSPFWARQYGATTEKALMKNIHAWESSGSGLKI